MLDKLQMNYDEESHALQRKLYDKFDQSMDDIRRSANQAIIEERDELAKHGYLKSRIEAMEKYIMAQPALPKLSVTDKKKEVEHTTHNYLRELKKRYEELLRQKETNEVEQRERMMRYDSYEVTDELKAARELVHGFDYTIYTTLINNIELMDTFEGVNSEAEREESKNRLKVLEAARSNAIQAARQRSSIHGYDKPLLDELENYLQANPTPKNSTPLSHIATIEAKRAEILAHKKAS